MVIAGENQVSPSKNCRERQEIDNQKFLVAKKHIIENGNANSELIEHTCDIMLGNFFWYFVTDYTSWDGRDEAKDAQT